MDVPEAIEQLGRKSPTQIIDLIESMGIKGVASHPCWCPVARLITAMTGRTVYVMAGRVRVGTTEWHPLPRSVRRAVSFVDFGKAKHLLEERI